MGCLAYTRKKNLDIFYKTSSDGGTLWSGDIQLTTDMDWNEESPSAAQISDKKIWIMWKSNKYGNFDIYCKTSSEIILHDVAITNVTPFSTSVYQGNH